MDAAFSDPQMVEDLKDLAKEQFLAFDRNGDNYLDAEEYAAALKEMGIHPENMNKVQKGFKYFDENDDGKISLQEFQELFVASAQQDIYRKANKKMRL